MRIPAFSVALAIAASLAIVPGASASRSQTTLFDLGVAGLNVPAAQRAEQLDQLRDFGVDTVRVIVTWRDLAPTPNNVEHPPFDATDPAAYPPGTWDALDDLVIGARLRGMDVLLTPSAPVPNWASASHNAIDSPSPPDFQQFIQALGTRYSGSYSPPPALPDGPANPVLPRVDFWSVWNEPNLELFLTPQVRHGKSISATIYRNLFLAARQGLAATGHGSDRVLIGETSPGPGRKGTDPVTFLRGVFCLNKKFKRTGGCAAINADGWAQHPYNPFDPPFSSSHNLIDVHSMSKLGKALNKARRAHATTRRLPIYVTEYGIESVPDRQFGVSQLRQAEFLGVGEYLMYRNPRIASFGQYLMQDDPGTAQVNFQTGLRSFDGAKKIAYDAFPVTLVAQRRSKKRHKVTIWGHVRPKGGPFPVTVMTSGRGGVQTLKRIQTSAAGYFQFSTRFRKGRRYSASALLPDGTQLSGPFVRVYVFK